MSKHLARAASFISVFLYLSTLLPDVHAGDALARIGQVSSSGKTITLNKGYNDLINTEDYGVLLAPVSIPVKDYDKRQETARRVYKPVAKLKAVKVFSGSSIWIAFKTFMPERLKKGAALMLLSESALMRGRKDLEVNRKTLVDERSKIGKSLKGELKAEGSALFEKTEDYVEGRTLHDQEEHLSGDVTLVDLEVWEKSGLPGQVYAEGFYKSPYAKDFSERIRVQRFEKMVAKFMKKFNDPEFSLEALYFEAKDDLAGHQDLGGPLGGDYKRKLLRSRLLKERGREKLKAELMAKGEAWSDNYSDEELSELLYNIGVVREKERREIIGAQKFDYQWYGAFGLNLLNNENLNDQQNTEESKYDFELGLEWYVLKNIEDLKIFTLEGSIRRSQDGFTTGDFNATGTEYSAAFGLNWYPFRPPNAMEENVVFLGMLFRYGWARYEIGTLGEEGNYQVFSFPGIRAGVKYNFSNGYGLRFAGTFENIIGDRAVRTEDAGELPDRVNHLEGKLSIGLSRFF